MAMKATPLRCALDRVRGLDNVTFAGNPHGKDATAWHAVRGLQPAAAARLARPPNG